MATHHQETRSDRDESDDGTLDGSGRGAVDGLERAASAMLGAALLLRGARRRSLRGLAAALAGGWLLYRGVAGNTRLRQALGADAATGHGLEERDKRRTTAGTADVERSITIDADPEELHEVWRDPEQLSRIVGHVGEVTAAGEDRWRWTVRGPRGRELTWETRIVEERPGELLRWESAADATVPNEGALRFAPAPGDRGTAVTLSVSFDPPGGALGTAALERLDVVPDALAGTALRRFKSLVETGEVPTTAANPSARGSGDLV